MRALHPIKYSGHGAEDKTLLHGSIGSRDVLYPPVRAELAGEGRGNQNEADCKTNCGFHEVEGLLTSFLADGELESRAKTTAMAFGHSRGSRLAIRPRLPGFLAGLAVSFAVDADRLLRGLSDPIRRRGRAHPMADAKERQAKYA
jgi:hypothetical protein